MPKVPSPRNLSGQLFPSSTARTSRFVGPYRTFDTSWREELAHGRRSPDNSVKFITHITTGAQSTPHGSICARESQRSGG